MHLGKGILVLFSLAVPVLILSACGSNVGTPVVTAKARSHQPPETTTTPSLANQVTSSSAPGSSVTVSITTTTTSSVQPSYNLVIANENGWTSAGLEGQVPLPGTCHYQYYESWVLPDPRCTPGSITPLVTSANLETTICQYGYSASVRPPLYLTEPEKFALMQAYGVSGSASNYEFDHLVPLELGGSSNLANMWPEPNQGSPSTFNSYSHYGNNAKDGVESQSNYAVCDRGYSLALAQSEIATNWVLAHQEMPN